MVDWVHPPKGRFFADPFLFRGWCFFEEWVGGKGRISVFPLPFAAEEQKTRFAAAGNKKPFGGGLPSPQAVLERPFHLSYPFVFQHDGQVYMLPEQSESNKLSLYRCLNFPYQWQEEAVLLDLPAVDATPHHDGQQWWLFLGIGKEAKHELQIWTAKKLKGPYHHHSTHRRPNSMRLAGALFHHQDRLIRPAQNRAATYGGSLLFYEVLELSNHRYQEQELTRWHPDASWPYPDGLHHLSSADGTLVIDAKRIVEDLND